MFEVKHENDEYRPMSSNETALDYDDKVDFSDNVSNNESEVLYYHQRDIDNGETNRTG
ncbi:8004_t:CDS:1, partial [Racocetra fulgida]